MTIVDQLPRQHWWPERLRRQSRKLRAQAEAGRCATWECVQDRAREGLITVYVLRRLQRRHIRVGEARRFHPRGVEKKKKKRLASMGLAPRHNVIAPPSPPCPLF